MKKTLLKLTALFLLGLPMAQASEQFVSLTLCSDRLLLALTRPEQIAAMSPYSTNSRMMLDKINPGKPTLEARLDALLPYLDKTILLNENFYPQLAADLRKFGAKIFPINDNPQTPDELFDLISQLGELTGNSTAATQLIAKLKSSDFNLQQTQTATLILSETGFVNSRQPQYQTLLNLLGLSAVRGQFSEQNFSLEQAILSQPNWLIRLTDNQGYNQQSEWLHHSLWQKLLKNRPHFSLPMKYTYCFDQGIWQGAAKLYQQFEDSKEKMRSDLK